jgi:hypothetical protein
LKRNFIIVGIFILLLIGLISVVFIADETQITYLVKINDIAYEQEDFNKFLAIMQYEKEKEIKDSNSGEQLDLVKLKKDTYNTYVEQNMYYQKAVENGVKITEETKKYLNDYYEGDKTDRERLTALGITKDDYLRIYSKSSIIQDFTKNLNKYYKIPETSVDQYLATPQIKDLAKMMDVRIMQFSVKENEKKEDVKAKAQSILDRAKAGEDFATLAKDNADARMVQSGDTYVIKNGEIESAAQLLLGELFTTEEMQAAVLKLKPGEFSEVYEEDGTFKFVKVEKITDGLSDEARKKVTDLLSTDYAVQVIRSNTKIIENKPLLKKLGLV